MLAALWGYDGWSNLSFVAGEVKDPGRNIPIAIIGSTMLIIVLYVFVHVAYFYVLDPTDYCLSLGEFFGRENRCCRLLSAAIRRPSLPQLRSRYSPSG